jgi:CheY-like chemotaxis protein
MDMIKTFIALEPLKILAVDDDLTLLRLYEVVLGRWRMGPRVTLAASGSEALRHIEQECPDLLLLDLNLPDVGGLELLRQLRADEGLRATTIVAVSGMSANDVDKRGGLPPGVILTSKPVQFAQLEALAMILKETKERGAQPDFIADRFPVPA